MEYAFRKASAQDIDRIIEIIEEAKQQMYREGKDQWNETYPTREHIAADVKDGTGYAMLCDGRIGAYGSVVFTGEPAYKVIKGKWLSEQPYVVLHRLAVTENVKGHGIGRIFMHEVERLALSVGVHSFKVDTNHDNDRMLHLLDKEGFTYCGDITYQGGYRMAYEKLMA